MHPRPDIFQYARFAEFQNVAGGCVSGHAAISLKVAAGHHLMSFKESFESCANALFGQAAGVCAVWGVLYFDGANVVFQFLVGAKLNGLHLYFRIAPLGACFHLSIHREGYLEVAQPVEVHPFALL